MIAWFAEPETVYDFTAGLGYSGFGVFQNYTNYAFSDIEGASARRERKESEDKALAE